MDRTACVDLPALPLQVLLLGRPGWASGPAAVVGRGRIRWANRAARRAGVRPGTGHAAAVAACPALRAAPVAAAEIATARGRALAVLRGFSPAVEPAGGAAGTFWLDATGLERLYGSVDRWAREVAGAVEALGLRARIAVGFTRFGAWAAARAGLGRGRVVFADPGQEGAAVGRVPLARLGLAPGLTTTLERLGITTVAAFAALPAGGVRERFGPEALRLHRLATGRAWAPLVPPPDTALPVAAARFDHPEDRTDRLLFRIKERLDPLLRQMAGRGEAVAELRLGLGPGREERIRPAAPACDGRRLLDLVRLRLEAAAPAGPVEELRLTAVPVRRQPVQVELFAARPRRDPDAAARALARVRAELGNGAVVRAVLRDAHLPEARFAWEPLDGPLPGPRPRAVGMRPVVRRLLDRPVPAPEAARAPTVAGPFEVSGGWWHREVRREYRFVRGPAGLWWVFRAGGRWYRHGEGP